MPTEQSVQVPPLCPQNKVYKCNPERCVQRKNAQELPLRPQNKLYKINTSQTITPTEQSLQVLPLCPQSKVYKYYPCQIKSKNFNHPSQGNST